MAILLAFAVGVIGAIGFSVHAQSISSTTPSNQTQVTSSSTQVSDGDGEQADDQNDTDVETNDDGGKGQAVDANDAHETEGAADVGEVEDGK